MSQTEWKRWRGWSVTERSLLPIGDPKATNVHADPAILVEHAEGSLTEGLAPPWSDGSG